MLGLYLFPTATTAAVCSANATTTQFVPYFGSGRTQKLGCWCCSANTFSKVAFITTLELRAKADNYFDQSCNSLRVWLLNLSSGNNTEWLLFMCVASL
jgi:hypothetical protein